MNLTIETEQEDDGRWIAEVIELPGVMLYGATEQLAIERVRELAANVIADRDAHGEETPDLTRS